MDPRHFWWLMEDAMDEQEAKRPGLSADERAELYDMLADAKADHAAKMRSATR